MYYIVLRTIVLFIIFNAVSVRANDKEEDKAQSEFNYSTSGQSGIDLNITDVYPSNPEVNTPIAVRFSLSVTDATGTVSVSNGTETCVAVLPIDSCLIFPTTVGLHTIVVNYSGDSTYGSDIEMFDITTIKRSFPQVVTYTDGTVSAWHYYGNNNSNLGDISSDGRYIVFQSLASNLVVNDSNGLEDIFIYDNETNTTELVSLSNDDQALNGDSYDPFVSDDGRYVAFESIASNIVSDDKYPNNADVFIRDRQLGTTTLVSKSTEIAGMSNQAESLSFIKGMSNDGDRILFETRSTNLDVLDTDTMNDIYIYEVSTSTLILASLSSLGAKGNSSSNNSVISGNGQQVSFSSTSTNLSATDINGNTADYFLRDLSSNLTEIVSVIGSGVDLQQANGLGTKADISSDGNRITFINTDSSWFENSDGVEAIYVRDRALETTYLISANTLGEMGNDYSEQPKLSGNGELVYFRSAASNLDSNIVLPIETVEIYQHNISTGDTQLLTGIPLFLSGSGDNHKAIPNNDGTIVALNTDSNRLTSLDLNSKEDIFYWSQFAQTIFPVSTGFGVLLGGQMANTAGTVSVDYTGDTLAFESTSDNLYSHDNNDARDAFVRDLKTNELLLINQNSNGVIGNQTVDDVFISANGQFIVVEAQATNWDWIVPEKTNEDDVYIFDRKTGKLSPVSIATSGKMGDRDSEHANISFDGRWVVFDSRSTDLVDMDTNSKQDIFMRDTWLDVTSRISIGYDGETNDHSEYPDITPDGRYIVFESEASNIVIGDTNGDSDIFLYDTELGIYTLVSVNSDGEQGNDSSTDPSISADGNKIVFLSEATNLDLADNNQERDVFIRDLATGETIWVSQSFGVSNNEMKYPDISANGRFVSFATRSNNMLMGEQDNEYDVFITDLNTLELRQVSVNSIGESADDYAAGSVISGNARFVFYESNAKNLVNNQLTPSRDIFKAHNPFLKNAPMPQSDLFEIFEDQILSVNSQNISIQSLLDNDIDPNDDTLNITGPLGSFIALGIGGNITLNIDGSFIYMPPENLFGHAYFYYKVSDGLDAIETIAQIYVSSVNDAPSFSNQGDVTINVDSDPYESTWASQLSPGPADESNQSLSSVTVVESTTGNISFVQNPEVDSEGVLSFVVVTGATGEATVRYTLMDDGGGNNSTSIIFNITVLDVIFENGFE